MAVSRDILFAIRVILNLGKIRIAQLVALSTACGYILAAGGLSVELFIPVSGVFLLALGSGAMNQYQERELDARMPRTARRPIPAGDLSPQNARRIALLLMAGGAVILGVGTNWIALALGIFTAVWYNAVYTPLKRIHALAVIPGSVIGALPPLIGWSAVDRNIFAVQPMVLALFFFIWQIPHFWLLLLSFGQDYVTAGYPSLTSILDNHRLGRITFSWIIATAVSVVFMPLFGFGRSQLTYFLLFIASVWLIWRSRNLLRKNIDPSSYRLAFHGINIFILAVMFILTMDRLLNA